MLAFKQLLTILKRSIVLSLLSDNYSNKSNISNKPLDANTWPSVLTLIDQPTYHTSVVKYASGFKLYLVWTLNHVWVPLVWYVGWAIDIKIQTQMFVSTTILVKLSQGQRFNDSFQQIENFFQVLVKILGN